VPIARTLAAAGVDGLCVATHDEGELLRAAGIDVPILVLYPTPPELAGEARHLGLTITAGDATLLERTLAAADRPPGPSDGAQALPPLSVAVEVETGLGRGGFDEAGIDAAVSAIARSRAARLAGLWTHLTAAEDQARSSAQERRFMAAAAVLAGGGVDLPRGMAASGAILAGGLAALEGVRPGLAVYGLLPDGVTVPPDLAALADALVPALALRARPVRVADLPAGTGVSYGPTFTTARPSRIATLPLGYGDGWPRIASGRADAIVRGARVPLVGTVSMDAVMADVTDVPGAPVSVDDEFTLIGTDGPERIGAHELARSRTTISWEVVTAMSTRLTRVYHAQAVPVGMRTLSTPGETAWPASSSGTATSATSRSMPS
jgi:alanine racemase